MTETKHVQLSTGGEINVELFAVDMFHIDAVERRHVFQIIDAIQSLEQLQKNREMIEAVKAGLKAGLVQP